MEHLRWLVDGRTRRLLVAATPDDSLVTSFPPRFCECQSGFISEVAHPFDALDKLLDVLSGQSARQLFDDVFSRFPVMIRPSAH